MKELFKQIIKFGIVGVTCFVIDFLIYALLTNVLGVHYLIAGATGFGISVIVNYLLSMHFVFARRDDISRKREFIVFLALSILGLGLNELILFICLDLIYDNSLWLSSWLSYDLAKLGAKILATGIVMVYNFVTRKIFLEKKS